LRIFFIFGSGWRSPDDLVAEKILLDIAAGKLSLDEGNLRRLLEAQVNRKLSLPEALVAGKLTFDGGYRGLR